MKKLLTLFAAFLLVSAHLFAQLESEAGKWKTWFISSGKDYRLTAPASYKLEIPEVLSRQKQLDATALQQIRFALAVCQHPCTHPGRGELAPPRLAAKYRLCGRPDSWLSRRSRLEWDRRLRSRGKAA